MKIYTGSGDRGKTSLFSGQRVLKSHIRVEACGEIDELNSMLGALASGIRETNPPIVAEIQKIQSCLLHIGAWLSTTPGSSFRSEIEAIPADAILFLEQAIDRMAAELPELKDFLLPGGHPSAAWSHVARAVCRRVERHVVRLVSETESPDGSRSGATPLVFLNRLSDYLFELARFLNQTFNVSETSWKK